MIMGSNVHEKGSVSSFNGPIPSLSLLPSVGGTIKISISGQHFELRRETLSKFPTTRLGKIAAGKYGSTGPESVPLLSDQYDRASKRYYFERSPECFPTVITYYTTGVLHVPRHVCIDLFQNEIEYWGIPFNLESCCQGFHQQEWDTIETVKKTNELFDNHRFTKGPSGSLINLEPEGTWLYWKRKVWDLFENQDSSKAASVISIISSIMVIISTITMCVNTLPEIQIRLADGTKGDNPNLLVIESICIIWFTFEYLARAISCPNKKLFIKSIMNLIDLLAILPFYISLFIENLNGNVNNNFTDVRRFVQVLRIFRIVRIFKVARHSTGLQVLGYTVRNSGSELGLLLMLLLMGMTLFSCLVYYAEQNEPDTKFESVIAAFWWAIITMTTVGYGDMHPKTVAGKIIGSLCCVSGIIFIALPIPTIVSNFSAFYKDHLNKEKLSKLYSSDIDGNSQESIIVKGSKSSIFNVNTIQLQKLSVVQLERHENYRRRMSSVVTNTVPENEAV